MLHTNVAELRLLVDTFTRVWSSGGQANLSLQSKDNQMWAKLDLQLGPAGSPRPGPPEAGAQKRTEHWNHQAQPFHLPQRLPTARRKGPAARARDVRRRQEWLEKKQGPALEMPGSQANQEQVSGENRSDSGLEQEDTAAKDNMAGESDVETFNIDLNAEVIPQLDSTVSIN